MHYQVLKLFNKNALTEFSCDEISSVNLSEKILLRSEAILKIQVISYLDIQI